MKWKVHEQGETVFFTIKHWETEGVLSPIDAVELREYLGEIMHDKIHQNQTHY
jgi:hypothetical protein